MRRLFHTLFAVYVCSATALRQLNYHAITVTDGGAISGTAKWSGASPRSLAFPITKDPQICDPDSKKMDQSEYDCPCDTCKRTAGGIEIPARW